MSADPALERHCRRLVRRQALKAAGVSVLPVPGADLFVNGQLLASTLGQISMAHGLGPDQLARLPSPLRSRVDDLAMEVGSYLIGRALTQGVLISALRGLGVRLGVQQAAKFAPVAGQVASAALSGWMFKRLCDRHLLHCQQVRAALPELPAPPLLPALTHSTVTH
ncbi:hypothetical protein C1M51_07645 [Methylibium sp. Pch-M]|uniref:hypothetical protein n=1 Tax=Methylibium sp. Pch-M TaxID=2082386 RepID=UPI001013C16B|nr:hypothetical protein [Methylibium sp. Pch-M]QAZ39312.1 hypothetical protein C1M51_07645 [Methylibium sp. Pch-M]